MGENVLKGQVESFKKGSDRSLDEMATPTLFDKSDAKKETAKGELRVQK